MSDKEMLNYAKAYRALIKEAERIWHEYCGDINDETFYWAFYWLIQQAECVQELKEENKRLREALEHIERIQSVDVAQQIARQALKE